MKDQYRIEKQYENVYEINEDGDAYEFLCTFDQIGATRRNREATILLLIQSAHSKISSTIGKIEAWKNQG